MKSNIILGLLLLGATAAASAGQDDRDYAARDHHERFHHRESTAVQAPELDASTLVAGLTLLGGAALILRARRSVKSI
jgi:hypothetical protein